MTTYIINANGYFFEVHEKVDLTKLDGCEVCPNRHIMYESLQATAGYDLDEIEGMELVIKRDHHNRLVCVEARGPVDYIEDAVEYQRGGLEEFIAEWVL